MDATNGSRSADFTLFICGFSCCRKGEKELGDEEAKVYERKRNLVLRLEGNVSQLEPKLVLSPFI